MSAKKIEDFTALDRIEIKLLENHTHYLSGELTEENVGEAVKWILFENLEKKPKKTLTLYINSTGGDLYETFGLIDVMRDYYHNISTVGIGAIILSHIHI